MARRGDRAALAVAAAILALLLLAFALDLREARKAVS